jgi:hypothetical protein
MGIIRMGPPEELCLLLRDRFQITDFVESGTYFGQTAVWASRHFANVVTMEYSRQIYDQTFARYGSINNIRFLFGDSRKLLIDVVPALKRPAIFWLDGHWSSGATYGEADQCPLLDEIAVIHRSPITHFLLIDDARLFLSPPPLPNNPDMWPSVDRVISALTETGRRYAIVVLEDVIICAPQDARQIVLQYSQDLNTSQWKEWGRQQQRSPFRKGCDMILQGMGLLARSLYNR